LAEQKAVLEEICEVADVEDINAAIISGDLFDTFNPSSEALDLFYKILKKLSKNGQRAVIAIAGNHDSPDRIEAPDPLARECGIIFIGYPSTRISPFALDTGLTVTKSDEGFIELKLPGVNEPLRIIHTSYANEYRLKTYLGSDQPDEELRSLIAQRWAELADKYCDANGINVLSAHLYMMIEGGKMVEEPEDEKPILHVGGAQVIFSANIPEHIQYTALGHLHRKQIVDEKPYPFIYSGSPLSYSFSEENQDKYIIIMEAEQSKSVKFKSIKLKSGKKLLRKRFEDVIQAVDWLKTNPNTSWISDVVCRRRWFLFPYRSHERGL
jgi:exonuclease SbcD